LTEDPLKFFRRTFTSEKLENPWQICSMDVLQSLLISSEYRSNVVEFSLFIQRCTLRFFLEHRWCYPGLLQIHNHFDDLLEGSGEQTGGSPCESEVFQTILQIPDGPFEEKRLNWSADGSSGVPGSSVQQMCNGLNCMKGKRGGNRFGGQAHDLADEMPNPPPRGNYYQKVFEYWPLQSLFKSASRSWNTILKDDRHMQPKYKKPYGATTACSLILERGFA